MAVAIALLASATVCDAITMATQQPEREFTLAPLCLAAPPPSSGELDYMLLWLLFGVSVICTTGLSIVVSREYAHYSSKITQNRKLRHQLKGELRQTLLDSLVLGEG